MPVHQTLLSSVAGVSAEAGDLLRRQAARGLADHAIAVARLTIAVSRTLELDEPETAACARAALFHDAGKLEVPPRILDRPAALSSAAWSLVRTHPERGERLVAAVPSWRTSRRSCAITTSA